MAIIGSGFGFELPQPQTREFDQLLSMVLSMLGGSGNPAQAPTPPPALPAFSSGMPAPAEPSLFNSPAQLPRMQATMQGMDNLNAGWQGVAGGGDPAGRPVVAVLDDFNSSHGGEIAGIIQRGGADTLNLNVNNGGDRVAGISAGLDNVLARLEKGQSIDAVNLSQQALSDGMENEQVRQKIQEIQSRGVPVVVAAGNGGNNTLARGAAFSVSNGSSNSGQGNIQAQGAQTSQATASVAAEAAKLHKQGASITQTQQQLGAR